MNIILLQISLLKDLASLYFYRLTMLILMIAYEKAHFNMKGKILTDQLFTYRTCSISYSFSLCLKYLKNLSGLYSLQISITYNDNQYPGY